MYTLGNKCFSYLKDLYVNKIFEPYSIKGSINSIYTHLINNSIINERLKQTNRTNRYKLKDYSRNIFLKIENIDEIYEHYSRELVYIKLCNMINISVSGNYYLNYKDLNLMMNGEDYTLIFPIHHKFLLSFVKNDYDYEGAWPSP